MTKEDMRKSIDRMMYESKMGRTELIDKHAKSETQEKENKILKQYISRKNAGAKVQVLDGKIVLSFGVVDWCVI